jgi:hypothetical protein
MEGQRGRVGRAGACHRLLAGLANAVQELLKK